MDCGFGFGHPYVGGDEEFYSILHEQKGYPGWKWDFDYARNKINASSGSGKLLDVGAGEGQFLVRMKENFECFALEGSETTRNELKSKGITVFADVTEAVEQYPGKFDYVTVFQVLEHLSDFRDLLSACKRLLKPGGNIILTVPDCDAMILQEIVTGCADMPPNHINKWTPNSLKIALNEAGFKTSTAIRQPDSYANITGALHLKLIHDATRKNTLASQVYKLRDKRVRVPFLALLAIPALLKMAFSFSKLRKGGSFAISGIA
ncbi:MAG: class I SAM-dependent methyltransferase [Ferruginibacter sp.]|nr:class I SAM-dependent methyltransferase [Cytophagales bacterium]